MSDMVRLVHHLASGAELLFSRMRAKVHGLCRESDVSRAATAIGRGALEDTSLWQHGSLAPISIEWLPMKSAQGLVLRTLRWPQSYGRSADYLFVEFEPVVADGIAGACRVRLWAAIFQSEPSLTSTRIQLPVTVSPGFKFGLLR